MEKFAEVLLKLESKDAITIANKYIMFKYAELISIPIIIGLIGYGIYFAVTKVIKNDLL